MLMKGKFGHDCLSWNDDCFMLEMNIYICSPTSSQISSGTSFCGLLECLPCLLGSVLAGFVS